VLTQARAVVVRDYLVDNSLDGPPPLQGWRAIARVRCVGWGRRNRMFSNAQTFVSDCRMLGVVGSMSRLPVPVCGRSAPQTIRRGRARGAGTPMILEFQPGG
jgi:hypothetical protein